MTTPEVAITELPDTPQKKKPKNITKKELEVEVTYYRAKEKELLESVGSLRKELEAMKAQIEELKRERVAFDPKKNVNRRTVDLEKKMAELEQYSRRECVELIGLPEDTHGEELENSVVQVLEIAGVNVEKRDFHAIHRLGNSKIVIAKLVNRRDAHKILRNKKKLRELPRSGKQKLRAEKIYVNEPLCSHNKRLLGKCNELFKKKQIGSFYTINGKIKIKYDSVDGECKTEILHAEDLVDIFGTEIMQEIDAERINR